MPFQYSKSALVKLIFGNFFCALDHCSWKCAMNAFTRSSGEPAFRECPRNLFKKLMAKFLVRLSDFEKWLAICLV